MRTLTGEELQRHVGKWNVAVLASDMHELVAPAKQVTHALRALLDNDVDVAPAWWQVTGTVMPPEIVAHIKMRTRLKPVLNKPHRAARLLAHWYANGRELEARGVDGYNHIAARMRAFTALLTRSELHGLVRASSVSHTQASLLPHFAYDWCLAGCVSAFLHVLPPAAAVHALHPLVGSPTCVPAHPGSPLVSVSADEQLPLEGGASVYGVLCTSAHQGACILVVGAAAGQTETVQLPVPTAEMPVWLTRYSDEWVVGYPTRVGPARGPWSVHAGLPSAGPVAKFAGLAVWKDAHGLRGYDVEQGSVVEDAVLHNLLVDRAHCLLGAQGKCVFAEGVPLFELPEEYTDVCAGVHRAKRDFVDVFTSRGDWWRVHVPTLSATVVGLDVPRGYVVKDTCVY